MWLYISTKRDIACLESTWRCLLSWWSLVFFNHWRCVLVNDSSFLFFNLQGSTFVTIQFEKFHAVLLDLFEAWIFNCNFPFSTKHSIEYLWIFLLIPKRQTLKEYYTYERETVMIVNVPLNVKAIVCVRFITLSFAYHCFVPQWDCACYLCMWISVNACLKACSHWSTRSERDKVYIIPNRRFLAQINATSQSCSMTRC